MDKLITQSGIIMRIPNTRSIVIGDEINLLIIPSKESSSNKTSIPSLRNGLTLRL